MTREDFRDKKSKEYRKYRENRGIKDPVYLDEIEDAYYQGMVDADAHSVSTISISDHDREEQINRMAKEIASYITSDKDMQVAFADVLKRGAEWANEHPTNLWKDAQGDDLPVYDREVIVLIQDYPDDEEHLRVAFGHRPTPNGYVTKDNERLYPMTYGKGGWNGKNVKYWLNVELPIKGD